MLRTRPSNTPNSFWEPLEAGGNKNEQLPEMFVAPGYREQVFLLPVAVADPQPDLLLIREARAIASRPRPESACIEKPAELAGERCTALVLIERPALGNRDEPPADNCLDV